MTKVISNDALVEMLKDASRRESGFRIFMQLYGKKIYWHIRRIVVSHEDAQDATQETAIRILNSIGSFSGRSALGTWVYRIATNEALQVLRHQTGFFQSVDALGESLAEKVESTASLDATRAQVLFQKALLQLPTQQRIAFNLRYYDELPYDDIAAITGKNANTLKTNYHLAQAKIKKYLTDNAL